MATPTTQEIIKSLKAKKANFDEAISIKPSPGIYAFFFSGATFPIEGHKPGKAEIIYLGKTESSGVGRVLNTHFGTGKTGSSTVRRTLSGLLRQKLKLQPIPRNQSDGEKGRNTFKLDETSEKKLTTWMKTNLLVSFYSIDSVAQVKRVEHKLIQELIPVLNLEGNPENSYKTLLSKKRKECGEIALGENSKVVSARKKTVTAKSKKKKALAAKRRKKLYVPIPSKKNEFSSTVSNTNYFMDEANPVGCILKVFLVIFGLFLLLIIIGLIFK